MGRPMKRGLCLHFVFLLLIGVEVSKQQEEDIPHNEVKNWAMRFGVDLWEFGKQVTKITEIKRAYTSHGSDKATVNKKDGLMLVREMAIEVKNLMDFKMNAVMRLMESAEHAAVSAPREGNASPKYYASHRLNLFTEDGKVASGAREMSLTPNRHFDHLAVNTSLSAVLLPPAIKDSDPEVAAAIQWSEHLDLLFINNYESDPTLSWQYYGATVGFLRRFPAISWPPIDTLSVPRNTDTVRDVYDFRISDWFIGGATSPKDLVILVDGSSLSSSKIRDLTISTTKTILESLGPADYVNIYKYGENAEEIIRCFKDSLVPANPENIKDLKVTMNSLKPDSPTNVTAAFSAAFELLNRYNKSGQGSQCNQAIMLVTSNTEAPSVDLIKKFNEPHKPVRIFSYLIGGDKSPDLYNLACTNKGFYARITNREEINSKVFEYVKVLSRPMVLYQHDHPIHWTPVYVGGKSSRYGAEYQGQLMVSVTAPILDRRNHSEKTANLLGIVGTDVPIEEIQKLIPPYKLGVNGYSFIVDNNGRVLYHPDLRPMPGNVDYEETLKPKYIGVDLSEVELTEYDGPSHHLNDSLLLDLRHEMVDQKEGETAFSVKVHYDDMKRVTIRHNKYFYKQIEGTPFSLGLALPEGYGMYMLHAEHEIKHTILNLTELFKGHWKVHPDWIYCEYNSASDKKFASPEERVLHFLSRSRKPGWKWMSLRPRSPSSHHKQASKPDRDAYYCDKTLVQSLVLDAKVTQDFEKKSEKSLHKEENLSQGKGRFGVARSFISTRSGLFRWHEHQQNGEPIEEPHFAETNRRAMDTSWYKRAVDQHSVEDESFVFSVPFDAAENPKTLVTATHSIFVENKGRQNKAPAAVVGLQFHHSSLASHFVNITSTCTGMSGCKKTCASEELDCYILDNNGFIIISEKHEHTGKFFGEIDGTIMDSLVQDKIFRKITIVDYQGACSPQTSQVSAAPKGISQSIFKMIASLGSILWSLTWNLNLQNLWQPILAYADFEDAFSDNEAYPPDLTEDTFGENEQYPAYPAVAPAVATPAAAHSTSIQYHKLRACEKRTDLYILQPERLNTSGQSNPLKGKLTNCHQSGCERPFSVQKIQHTNLILLVVDTLCPCLSKKLSIRPIEVLIESGACSARRERLYRRRPGKCINYHPEEMEIKFCGGTNELTLSLGLIFATILIHFT